MAAAAAASVAAVDPTVELLTALNRALSEGRITPEEYGKRAKMVSAVKAQREEDRRVHPA